MKYFTEQNQGKVNQLQWEGTSVSPNENSTSLAATATAAPLEAPPGTRAGAAGFVGVS